MENKIIEILFVHGENVDSVVLNLTLGYITGYIIYVLSVMLPQEFRNIPATKETLNQLILIYYQSIYLLLLMYKSECTIEEWENISEKERDIDCLNDEFIEKMNTFDIQALAYTLFKKKNGESLNWLEYLTVQYENIYKKMNDLFVQYNSYLDDELVELLMQCKNSRYLDMFLGNNSSYSQQYMGTNNMIYYETLPLNMLYESNPNLSPIFHENLILKEYIVELEMLHKFLKSKKIVWI